MAEYTKRLHWTIVPTKSMRHRIPNPSDHAISLCSTSLIPTMY
jgi:hypothetical protein